MEVSGQLHAFATLPQEKEQSPGYPSGRRGHQSGHNGEEKNFQPMLGLEPLIIQLIAQCYTTELSCLLILTPVLVEIIVIVAVVNLKLIMTIGTIRMF
jgi:hypothetical protein